MNYIECADGFRVEVARVSVIQNTILFNTNIGNANAIKSHFESANSFTFKGKTYTYKKVLSVRQIGNGAKVSLGA